MLGIQTSVLAAIHSDQVAATARWNAATIGLFTNDIDAEVDHVAGDFTVPTFTGYAAATPTFTVAYDAAGRPRLAAIPLPFKATDTVNLPQIIKGWFMLDSGGDYQCCGVLEQPIVVQQANQPFHVTPEIPIQINKDWPVEAYIG